MKVLFVCFCLGFIIDLGSVVGRGIEGYTCEGQCDD